MTRETYIGIMLGVLTLIGLFISMAIEKSMNDPNIQESSIDTLNYHYTLCYKCDTTYFNLATTYQCKVDQCDSTPNRTADGSIVDTVNYPRWVALSRDLIWCPIRQEKFPNDTHHWRGPWAWGDTITFYSIKHPQINGDWVVHDCKPWGDTLEVDFIGYITPKLGLGKDVKAIECGYKY